MRFGDRARRAIVNRDGAAVDGPWGSGRGRDVRATAGSMREVNGGGGEGIGAIEGEHKPRGRGRAARRSGGGASSRWEREHWGTCVLQSRRAARLPRGLSSPVCPPVQTRLVDVSSHSSSLQKSAAGRGCVPPAAPLSTAPGAASRPPWPTPPHSSPRQGAGPPIACRASPPRPPPPPLLSRGVFHLPRFTLHPPAPPGWRSRRGRAGGGTGRWWRRGRRTWRG